MKNRYLFIGVVVVLGSGIGLLSLLRGGRAIPETTRTAEGPPTGAELENRGVSPAGRDAVAPSDDGESKPVSPRAAQPRLPGASQGERVPNEPVAPANMERMNVGELLETEPGLTALIQQGIANVTRENLSACIADYRRSYKGSGAAPALEHTVVLAVSSRNGKAVVREAAGDEGWPAAFPTELQECLVDGFAGAAFEADRDFDYKIEFPIVVR